MDAQGNKRVKVMAHPFAPNRQVVLLHATKAEVGEQAWERIKALCRTNGSRMFTWANGLNCLVGYAYDDETLGSALAIAAAADKGAAAGGKALKSASGPDMARVAEIAQAFSL